MDIERSSAGSLVVPRISQYAHKKPITTQQRDENRTETLKQTKTLPAFSAVVEMRQRSVSMVSDEEADQG